MDFGKDQKVDWDVPRHFFMLFPKSDRKNLLICELKDNEWNHQANQLIDLWGAEDSLFIAAVKSLIEEINAEGGLKIETPYHNSLCSAFQLFVAHYNMDLELKAVDLRPKPEQPPQPVSTKKNMFPYGAPARLQGCSQLSFERGYGRDGRGM